MASCHLNGPSCLLNVGQVVLCEFSLVELSSGELSLGRVVLCSGLRPMQSLKRNATLLVHCSCSYIYMQEFCSSKCHIPVFRPFHKNMNTFVWLLFSVPENKYGYARAGTLCGIFNRH